MFKEKDHEKFFLNIEKFIRTIDKYEETNRFLNTLMKNNSFSDYVSDWKNYFEFNKKEANKSGLLDKIHSLLAFVMLGTMTTLRKGYFNSSISNKGIKIPIEHLLHELLDSVVCEDENSISIEDYQAKFDSTSISVIDKDMVDIAEIRINKNKEKVAILNMASRNSPNGGWKNGAWAQEECLTRRSNYHLFLNEKHKKIYSTGGLPEFGGIYSKNVYFFRGNEKEGYPFLEKPFTVDCIAVAAYNLKEEYPSFYESKTERKINAIFKMAVKNKVETLILSAFGCGAFKNDPDVISKLFRKILTNYAGYFKNVIFAIIDVKDVTSRKTSNYDIFSSIFEGEKVLFKLPQCKNGLYCEKFDNPIHEQEFRHFQKCFLPDCKNTEPTHIKNFWHMQKSGSDRQASSKNRRSHSIENLPSDFQYHDKGFRFNQSAILENKEEKNSFSIGLGSKNFSGNPLQNPGKGVRTEKYEINRDIEAQSNKKGLTSIENQRFTNESGHKNSGLWESNLTKDKSLIMQNKEKHACRYNGICTLLYEDGHLLKYTHPTKCPLGIRCTYQDFEHFNELSHDKKQCPENLHCIIDKNKLIDHLKFYSHEFYPLCKYQRECKKIGDQKHLSTYSHICSDGEFCKSLTSKTSFRKKEDIAHCKVILRSKALLLYI